MKIVYIITLILIIIAVLLAFIILLYRYFKEKLVIISKHLNDTETEYNEKFNNKVSILNEFITLIVDKYKIESKTFDSVKKLNDNITVDLKTEKLLNKCYKELIEVKEDKQKSRELKAFREVINKYEENEITLVSLRTYYNKYALVYNNMIKSFPYSLIARFKRLTLFDNIEGKELESSFNNNLEV